MIKRPLLADDDLASLERATLDAVAPPEIQEVTDWLIPLDRSTIGRAKSAVPLRHQGLNADALDGIEAAYHDWGIEAQFRVADVLGLGPIHQRLRVMRYAPDQPTLVQVGTVSALLALPPSVCAAVDTHPNARWASVYTAPGFDSVDGAHRVKALSRSAHVVYAAVHSDDQALAAGTASFSRGWASIHGMRTVTAARCPRSGVGVPNFAGLGRSSYPKRPGTRVFASRREQHGCTGVVRARRLSNRVALPLLARNIRNLARFLLLNHYESAHPCSITYRRDHAGLG